MRKIAKYLRDVKGEMGKVTWPKRDAIIKLTIIVMLITTIVGIYLGGLDYIFTLGLERVLGI